MDKPGIENWTLTVIGWRLTTCAMGRRAQLLFFAYTELNLFSVFYLIGLLLSLGIVKNIVLIRERCNTCRECCSVDGFTLQRNYFSKVGRSGQQIRNIWKVLKCGAGEGWRRSVGPIM